MADFKMYFEYDLLTFKLSNHPWIENKVLRIGLLVFEPKPLGSITSPISLK